MLFEKDVAEHKQLEILRDEVAKGFEQLASGESSKHNVMDIFEQALEKQTTNKNTNV